MKKIIILCALLCVDAKAFLNIESLRQNAGLKKGITGSTQLRLNSQKGNVNKTLMNFNTLNMYKKNRHGFLVLGSYQYGQSRDIIDTREGNIHFRYMYNLTDRVDLESFAQAEFNKFQDLLLRQLYGAGARFTLIRKKSHGLYFGAGAFYENENIESGIDQKNPRTNLYLSYQYTEKDSYNLSSTLYYQANTERLDDYRFRLNLGLETYFGEHFIQQIEYSVRRDTYPPIGIQKTDSSVTAGIGISY